MSFILNEFEVETAVLKYGDDPRYPNLRAAAITLDNLVAWTNSNSDGWPYWGKPAQASKHLQQLIYDADYEARFGAGTDITREALRAALRPVKAFRTRQSATFTIEEPT